MSRLFPNTVCLAKSTSRSFSQRALHQSSIACKPLRVNFFNTHRPLQRALSLVKQLLQKRSYNRDNMPVGYIEAPDPYYLLRLLVGRATVWIMITASVLVFVLKLLPSSVLVGFKTSRDLHDFLDRNLVLSRHNLDKGRWWTCITHTFNHVSLLHLACNMYVLWKFGGITPIYFGAMGPLICYVVGGINAGALLILTDEYETKIDRVEPTYCGASGADAAIVAALSFYSPWIRVGLPLLPGGLPGWFAVSLFAGVSLILARMDKDKAEQNIKIAHMGHVGGVLSGAAIALIFKIIRMR